MMMAKKKKQKKTRNKKQAEALIWQQIPKLKNIKLF